MPYIDKPLSAMRVLAADDNEVNRLFLDGILKTKVQQLLVIDDGKTAIQAGLSQPWDLIILDLHMPGADGIEVLQTLHSQADQAHKTLFVIITADARKSEQDRLLKLGFHGFLTKPISRDALISGLAAINAHPGQPVTIARTRQATHSILDDTAALDVLNHDQELLSKMRSQFIAELIPGLNQVTAGLQTWQSQPDDQAVQRAIWDAVHKIAGGCAYTGAYKLAEICTRIQEQIDAQASLESVLTDYLQLRYLIEQTVIALQASVHSKAA